MYGNFVDGVWKANLSTVSTADLQAELSRREGVNTYVVYPEDSADIAVRRILANDYADVSGPAIITVNID